MAVGAFIKAATFSDGSRLSFRENDILVIAGPNNAGKSAALASLTELFHNQGPRRAVVTGVERSTKGSVEELLSWLETTSYVYPMSLKPTKERANPLTWAYVNPCHRHRVRRRADRGRSICIY